MQWDKLVTVWQEIEAISLRNKKTELLSTVWKEVTPEEAQNLCYLTMGRVAPLYEPIELGMAEKSLLRVVAWVGKKPLEEVTEKYKKVGDLGEVIGELRKPACRQAGLGEPENPKIGMSVVDVYDKLLKIARMNGAGSQEGKVVAMGNLLMSLSPLGAKYVMRLVSGKLRLGLMDMTVIDSLSWARTGDKQDRSLLEHAYNVSSDLGLVARQYLITPQALTDWQVRPGVPVRPMRAERLGTVEEIVAKLGECAVEPKLDGMRVQVHAFGQSENSENLPAGRQDSEIRRIRKSDSQSGLFEEEEDDVEVRIFSRGLEDITNMFPEVVQAATLLHQEIGDFVLDGEALGVDAKGNYLPFQETMTRKRKYGIEAQALEKPLRVVVFDILYGSGQDRLRESYEERRKLLEKSLSGNIFKLAESTKVTKVEEMKALFTEAMKKNLEGILVKKLTSPYRAGARDFAWVKYKRAHETELADTIDAVVMGAYVGRGKRNKFGVGAFLVGVRDKDKIVTVAKIGTGLTDEQFGELYKKIQEFKDPSSVGMTTYDVPKSLTPDVWVEPKIIVEIEADEITVSPLHTAGLALRFPRLIRFREDKTVNEITTAEELSRLFEIGRGK